MNNEIYQALQGYTFTEQEADFLKFIIDARTPSNRKRNFTAEEYFDLLDRVKKLEETVENWDDDEEDRFFELVNRVRVVKYSDDGNVMEDRTHRVRLLDDGRLEIGERVD